MSPSGFSPDKTRKGLCENGLLTGVVGGVGEVLWKPLATCLLTINGVGRKITLIIIPVLIMQIINLYSHEPVKHVNCACGDYLRRYCHFSSINKPLKRILNIEYLTTSYRVIRNEKRRFHLHVLNGWGKGRENLIKKQSLEKTQYERLQRYLNNLWSFSAGIGATVNT